MNHLLVEFIDAGEGDSTVVIIVVSLIPLTKVPTSFTIKFILELIPLVLGFLFVHLIPDDVPTDSTRSGANKCRASIATNGLPSQCSNASSGQRPGLGIIGTPASNQSGRSEYCCKNRSLHPVHIEISNQRVASHRVTTSYPLGRVNGT
jgi:hypothetical protein